MPYVNIKITRDGATAEQKAQLIKGTTELLVNILGKTRPHSWSSLMRSKQTIGALVVKR